nr:MAG TPA: hypothetical protein [Bacteriophage sp.]
MKRKKVLSLPIKKQERRAMKEKGLNTKKLVML